MKELLGKITTRSNKYRSRLRKCYGHCSHPDISLISSGSSAIGKQINEVAGATLQQCFLGLAAKRADSYG
jgi:hypothetical protein